MFSRSIPTYATSLMICFLASISRIHGPAKVAVNTKYEMDRWNPNRPYTTLIIVPRFDKDLVTFRYQKAKIRPESRRLLQASASRTQADSAHFPTVFVRELVFPLKWRIYVCKASRRIWYIPVMKALWVLKFRSGHDSIFFAEHYGSGRSLPK